jgi:DNA-binding MarR family transcriptional regulator
MPDQTSIDSATLVSAVRALARASRVVERASADLSFADYRVLAALDSGEERASRLADRLAVGKPAISATVDSLHRRGLIRRDAVEADARATSLAITDAGRELFGRMEGRMARQLELLAERTPDPAALVASLATLGTAIDEAVAQRRAPEAATAEAQA